MGKEKNEEIKICSVCGEKKPISYSIISRSTNHEILYCGGCVCFQP